MTDLDIKDTSVCVCVCVCVIGFGSLGMALFGRYIKIILLTNHNVLVVLTAQVWRYGKECA